MKKITHIALFISSLILFSCETAVNLDIPDPENRLVVEGYIENDIPPYVLLSYNIPINQGLNFLELEQYFIEDAEVKVSNNTDTVTLREYSPGELSVVNPDLYTKIANRIGFSPNIFRFFSISIYTVDSIDYNFKGSLGNTYHLSVKLDNDSILGNRFASATTTIINDTVDIDSIFFEPNPDPEFDSLVVLKAQITDPPELGNFFRYFTRVNSGPWLINFNTVFDDVLINGDSFAIEVPLGVAIEDIFESRDFNTAGFYKKGDTCSIRIALIDIDHYNFWRTAEEERGSIGSPFSRGIQVRSNIEGGFGIWGGLASVSRTRIAE